MPQGRHARAAWLLLLVLAHSSGSLFLTDASSLALATGAGQRAPAVVTDAQPPALELCTRPGACRRVPAYAQSMASRWSCPPFAPRCTLEMRRTAPASGVGAAAARVPAEAQLRALQHPKIISSQLAMPLYQFTAEHAVLEAARRLLQAGATSFKFDLKNQRADGTPIRALRGRGWLPLVTHGQLPYGALLDMPFTTFVFWAGRLPPPGRGDEWSDVQGVDVYREMYRLATHLIKRYDGSNKTFLIGHWEGDWGVRDAYDAASPANATKVAAMVRLLSAKQRAIDDARRDSPRARGVRVWHYAEANLVEQSLRRGRGWASMLHSVLPAVRPPLDYVSVSLGGDSLREPNPAPALHRTLDYAAAALPPKPGVPQPRVFVGEFYYDLRNRDDARSLYAPTPEAQRERGCWAAAAGLAWGVRHMFWWQLYDNELTSRGNYRGYMLVGPDNKDTPLFGALQTYYADAQRYVRSVLAATGAPPGEYAFRSWAVRRLVELSGRRVGAPPGVRYLGS